jgi:hypothetical protein
MLAACVAVASPVAAQFGHPLKGSWSGDWGPTRDQRTRVLLELTWDGKVIGGTINPGPNAVPLKVATLDPSTWAVHLEAEAKDAAKIVVDGKLENIGAYRRVLSGTWTQGGTKGDFRLVLN